jgi:penicillin amidase
MGLVVILAAAAISAQQGTGSADLKALAKQSLAQLSGTLNVEGLRAPVEVVRDRWGVPHIYAQNTDDLFLAQGYVM